MAFLERNGDIASWIGLLITAPGFLATLWRVARVNRELAFANWLVI